MYVSALYYFLRAMNAPSNASARTALPAEHPPLELPTPVSLAQGKSVTIDGITYSVGQGE